LFNGGVCLDKEWDSNTLKDEEFLLNLKTTIPQFVVLRKLIFWSTLLCTIFCSCY